MLDKVSFLLFLCMLGWGSGWGWGGGGKAAAEESGTGLKTCGDPQVTQDGQIAEQGKMEVKLNKI